ncbi:PREDICTED: NADH dehydrogenase [ubiquinone] 1 alpha subcomplex subunit 2 [Nipponia nippon]|uniref:NADH dehydrogenase [ubiquinone] 1 alpha subcomplex subunit 2 n=1 Tax=Nipponia nippon TaxID=128390 RepID=UPI0005107E98|nr:PREDICTED: NADH dehydrogenase [ubiquinone] 1 alpha subcomplex subunit 2 [Nipponia nippon]
MRSFLKSSLVSLDLQGREETETIILQDFIEQHYVTLKKANPDFPILIRECSGVQPKLWARYEFGKEKSVLLNNFTVDEVAKALENIVKSQV